MKECPECGRCFAEGVGRCPDEGAELEARFDGPPLLGGRYHLVRRIGGGGSGAVYRARHSGLDRAVAVKILHRGLDRRAREGFRREARALGRLRHPNVVAVQDYDVDGERDLPFLVMDLIEGTTLDRLLARGPLPGRRALEIAEAIAGALQAAHEQGILHRDLKPSNVLLDLGAGAERIQVADFGLATFLEDQQGTPPMHEAPARSTDEAGWTSVDTLTHHVAGTPAYMAPSVLHGRRPSPATDAWSLAVLTWEAIAGCRPYRGETVRELLAAIASGPPPLPPAAGAGPHLARCLAESLRPGSRELERPVRELVVGWRRAHARDEEERRVREARPLHRRLAAVAAAGCLALTLGLLGAVDGIERRLVDWRMALGDRRPPTAPLTVLALDDVSLGAASAFDRADEVGATLQALVDAGARGVAIDLLLPARWGRSSGFVRPLLRAPDRFVLAMYSPDAETLIGPEVADGLLAASLGPGRIDGLFGFAGVAEDGDGRVRQAETRGVDALGRTVPSFAALVAQKLGAKPDWPDRVWIDTRTDVERYPWISWRELEEVLERQPHRVRERIVIVAGTWVGAGDDEHTIGVGTSAATLPGPLLQCLIAETLWAGVPIREVSPAIWSLAALGWAWWMAAGGVRHGRPVLAGSLAVAAWVVTALAAFVAGGWLVPIVAPGVALATTQIGVAVWWRRDPGSRRLWPLQAPSPMAMP